jgi:two-component system phosphate regulon sensor histidine kinase PhoR
LFEPPDALGPQSDANILARILARNASLLQCAGSGVFIWDENRHALTAMTPFIGLEDGELSGVEFPVGGTQIGGVVLHDRPIVLDELGDGPADEAVLRTLGVQNVLAVPLAVERRNDGNDVVERSVFGVCCAINKYYGRTFDQEDARLLTMMARQVSAVLVTSNLYWQAVERRKELAVTIESMSVGLIAITPKGTVTQLNAAARRALCLDAQGWFGRPYDDVIVNQQVCAVISAALVGDPYREIEIPMAQAEEERIYRVQSDSIVAEEGQSLGWVIVLEDVTDIRQAEQMMAAFVDMVSHELRTPLTSIRGFVATMLQAGEGGFDWETQQEFLGIVDTEAERLGQMIDDLLNIARIKGGRGLQFNFTLVDLNAVVARVVRLQSQGSYMRGHDIAVDVQGSMEIRCDEGKVEQVLNNLLGNALKYSPNGGRVEVRGRVHEGGVLISVSDQGMGIPKEQLPKMFGQFFRVEGNHMAGIKGTGLGLWLTKHLVEGHGGRIWVESEFGKGSTFLVWLPKDPTSEIDEPPSSLPV